MSRVDSRCWSILFRRRRPLTSTLFPYTTLFRSEAADREAVRNDVRHQRVRRDDYVRPWDQHGVQCLRPAEEEVREVLQVVVVRSEEHTSELQSQSNLVCRLLLEKNNFHMSISAL